MSFAIQRVSESNNVVVGKFNSKRYCILTVLLHCITFIGSIIAFSPVNVNMNATNHPADFFPPHSKLYNKVKNADARITSTTSTHAMYMVHRGSIHCAGFVVLFVAAILFCSLIISSTSPTQSHN